MTPGTSFEQNILAPSMFHAKYQCIPETGSLEEDFLRLIKIFLILPLIGHQKGPAPLSEQSESPSPKHVSHQDWLKLAK